MIIKWTFIAVVLYLDLVYCVAQELKITKGVIKGKFLKSRNGRSYYSYTGIPYAKPPIGELRFKVYNLFTFIILYINMQVTVRLNETFFMQLLLHNVFFNLDASTGGTMGRHIGRYERIKYMYSTGKHGRSGRLFVFKCIFSKNE